VSYGITTRTSIDIYNLHI